MSQDEIINTLKSLVEIPSVSSDKKHDKDVESSAEFVNNLLAGLDLIQKSQRVAEVNQL